MTELTPAQLNDLRVTARKTYDRMDKEAERFCYRHGLDEEGAVTNVMLMIVEAYVFAVLANHVVDEYQAAVLDHLKGGVLTRLKEFSQQPGNFVKLDS